MRLIGFEHHGTPWIGRRNGDGSVLALAPRDDFYADVGAGLAAPGTPVVGEPTPADLVPATARVFCIGLNYRGHAAEASATLPAAPTVFGRWTSSLALDGEALPLGHVEALDWEGELAVVIGRPCAGGDAAALDAAVLGYTVFNDLTGRALQTATTQWTLGKNLDRSGPLGPELVTVDEAPDLAEGGRLLETRVNDQVVQSASTAQMIFPVRALVAHLAAAVPLLPGDVIATGTPDGVGHFRDPQVHLRRGDRVSVSIEGIGTLTNTIA